MRERESCTGREGERKGETYKERVPETPEGPRDPAAGCGGSAMGGPPSSGKSRATRALGCTVDAGADWAVVPQPPAANVWPVAGGTEGRAAWVGAAGGVAAGCAEPGFRVPAGTS